MESRTELNEQVKKATLGSYKKNRLKRLIEFIIVYYALRKVNNMFFDKVVHYLSDKSSIGLSREEIKELLRYSISTFPNWLVIIQNKNGEILRMNNDINKAELFRKVDGL